MATAAGPAVATKVPKPLAKPPLAVAAVAIAAPAPAVAVSAAPAAAAAVAVPPLSLPINPKIFPIPPATPPTTFSVPPAIKVNAPKSTMAVCIPGLRFPKASASLPTLSAIDFIAGAKFPSSFMAAVSREPFICSIAFAVSPI